MNRKHDSDVACHYFDLEALERCLTLVLSEVHAGTDSKPYKTRPSGSISPKRELQSLRLSPGS